MNWEPNCTIYRIVCFRTGEIYIGQTGAYRRRVWEHLDMLKHGHHANHKLQTAYNEYGRDAFYFEPIEEVPRSKGNEREVYWVEYYDSFFNGFNLTLGGNVRYGIPYIADQIRLQKAKDAA